MTALERDGIDLPNIALVAERIDVCVLDLAMLTGAVDGLRLRLTGNGLAVLVAALHAALEAFCRCGGNRLGDRLVVEEILFRLGEQENMLVAAGASVFHALRHGVILHPDDVVAQIPAGIAESKSQHPRDADHILRLAALNLVVESHRLTISAIGVLRVNEIALIALSGVGVRDVQPERSIRTQNAPDFGKHFRQARDIFLRRCLSADLVFHAVIAECVIRWGRHTAMNAVIGQSFQDFKAIAGMNDVKLYGGVPPVLLDLCFH